nr:unnamed protein product [Callosobruchus chinensis]
MKGIYKIVSLFYSIYWNKAIVIICCRATYALAGLQPFWFHLGNVLLHAAASSLFARTCLRVADFRPHFAALAGLLFAVHPVHTEAVTGIVGRADVLACIFFLLSLLAYHGQPKCHIWISITVGALSMFAKETGVTVLLLNLAYDFYLHWSSIRWSLTEMKCNREAVGFASRAAKILTSLGVLLALRLAILQGSLPRFSQQDNPAAFHPSFYVRILTFCYLAAFNWWLLLCPVTLSHDWQMGSIPLVTTINDSRNLMTILMFGITFLVTLRCLQDFENQKHTPMVLGLMLLIIPFLPAANLLVTVGFVVAERVLYIPSLGSIVLTVYGVQILWYSWTSQRQTIACFVVLLLATGCMRTIARNRDWRSRESLLRAGLTTLPQNAKMHYNYGNFLRDTNKFELAKAHYYSALKLWPSYASAHNNLGTLLNYSHEAEHHFLEAIKHSSDHVNAHYNLGQLYRKMNRTADSEVMLRRCINLEPTFTPAYVELAKLQDNDLRIIKLLRRVVELNPNDPYFCTAFGYWLFKKGLYEESLRHYHRSLQISPTYKEAFIGVARVLRKLGQSSRLFQIITRWQLIHRNSSNEIKLSHVYLLGWSLRSELTNKAKAYDVYYEFGSSYDDTEGTENCSLKTKWSKQKKNKTSSRSSKGEERIRTTKYVSPFIVHHLLDSL